ncbi:RBBP9/YdeN family alpha/beta hydrolase [Lonepinella sp. BR2919]|uniref:RBBP9/YdeN family alpha/beta hydrolase n=1 Tax=unclassified Lonepinella TaxID=2642006 RepID=UPI003F6DD06B
MLNNIYITHGYTANSQKHWFPWLKVRLENQNIATQIFDMPNSSQPDPQEWLTFHQNNIHQLDQNSYFIGHSLGCIATLRFLQQAKINVGGVILVSGFAEKLPNLPELDKFNETLLNFTALIEQIPQRVVIASDDDDVVNVQFTRHLAQNLQANYIEVSSYHHFLDRQGVTELPLLYNEVLKMINN